MRHPAALSFLLIGALAAADAPFHPHLGDSPFPVPHGSFYRQASMDQAGLTTIDTDKADLSWTMNVLPGPAGPPAKIKDPKLRTKLRTGINLSCSQN